MPSPFTRTARRAVPIKSAILAGAAPARRRMVHPAPANHPRRRAEDFEQSPVVVPVAQNVPPTVPRDGTLMNDGSAADENARAIPAPWWVVFWGWLPRAPRD